MRGLKKAYGSNKAVRGLDLDVMQGEVFALLGPNGAGKTTTVEILEGHRSRDEGQISVLGFDPRDGNRQLKERIGIVLQTTGVEPYLSVEETIDLYRSYYRSPLKTDEVLEATGLVDLRRSRVRKLSGGQQRRLDVAVGLAGDPDLLFLDEPTTGFDPVARRGAWEMVKNLRQLGKTVFLTTHYMDEAENLADSVALIVRGEIVAEGKPGELSNLDKVTTISFLVPDDRQGAPEAIRTAETDTDGLVTLSTESPTRLLREITSWASDRGLELERLSVSRASLEDVYIDLVGEDKVQDSGE